MDIDPVPHLDELWRYARVLTRDDADADDLLQEALARALAMQHAYDRARPLAAWLMRIVRNTHLTGLGRRNTEQKGAVALVAAIDPACPPCQVEHVELRQVAEAVDALPREHAEILHLVGVLGYSYQDAADLLDVPVGTAMSRLSRARATLRALVRRAPGDERTPGLRVVIGGRNE
ncbi:sigma-70 family RNA polymerase sigma factor [Chthonobacter rhizosphaerae]|uniref:sigma-70 family RNA polymerase sigma factor n=1 Tax=Chthonobacter rhizosphaerae TaxID=2735553 RepID=UPI0015EE88D9|nr:sigma-70 family RNA polymerase sigma factor [Chthonobacter rhizosphaerae]